MALVELRDIRKIYRVGDQDIAALDGVSLTIDAGEFLCIIGPSGSGKSTLMHLLGCLDTPTSGSLVIDGVDVSNASDDQLSKMRNSKIGFVFQAFNLLPKLDVLHNVELPMVYAGVSAKVRRERAIAAIERVDLAHRMYNTPLQLSGGQCQRVAIARAIVNTPKIVFADEPTGNLDSKTGETILTLFRELAESGCTIVIVTHDNNIASRLPRRIEMRDGLIRVGVDAAISQTAPLLVAHPAPQKEEEAQA
ncbi:MAG: ABC transporter ATP-binding protein [Chthoniobacteraceae bacterium]